jgi:glycosyltransferase involved in cell wall biosynthesis
MSILFWLAVVLFLLTVAIYLEIGLGLKSMTRLADVPVLTGGAPPVTIIIPACNEEETIAPALASILALEYGELEIIVVNDRSTDGTGQVLLSMQKRYPRLRILNIHELPRGWLGKNHALQVAAGRAGGDYLLFTDADVIFEKTTLARAMRHMLTNDLDHMSMFFESKAKGGLLNALFMDTGGGLLLLFKPWKAKESGSRRYMGVGAFNLMKKRVYRAIGGHATVAMHPLDDVMLGKVIKQHGFRQDCLSGYGFISVCWYGSVRELIGGLMKNTFAVYNYRVSLVLISIVLISLLNILPLFGVLFGGGAARALFGSIILIRLLFFVHGASIAKISPWSAPFSLLSPAVALYIIVKATVTTLVHRGITWRGTFYSLEKLKENRL